jgi:hypothetical protein
MRPAPWLTAALALTLAAPGCASFSKYRARAAQLRIEMEAYRYPQPIELVWPQVQRLLADKGLDLAGADAEAVGQKKPGTLGRLVSAATETHRTGAGGRLLETDWNRNGLRWRAEATPDAGGLRVVLTQIKRKADEVGDDEVTLREYGLELDLLYRIDPEAGEKIEERAGKTAAADR